MVNSSDFYFRKLKVLAKQCEDFIHIFNYKNDIHSSFIVHLFVFRSICACLHNNHRASHTNGNLLEVYSTRDMAPTQITWLSLSTFSKSDCHCNCNCMGQHSLHLHHSHNGRSSLVHMKYKLLFQ